jgi:hypothetical protein
LGEILLYEPDRNQGVIYSLREGRTLPFKLSDSPGLPGELLRPGIQVHFFTAPDGRGGFKAVQMTLEPVASLDARLRFVAKRAALRERRRREFATHKGTKKPQSTALEQQEDIAFMSTGVSERGRRGFRSRGKEAGDERSAAEHRQRAAQASEPEDVPREKEGSQPGDDESHFPATDDRLDSTAQTG